MMDYRSIQEDFNRVIACSQEICDVDTDTLFQNWEEGKSSFIEKWGGLTYEFPEEVHFSRTIEEKQNLISLYLRDICYSVETNTYLLIKEFFDTEGVNSIISNRASIDYDNEKNNIHIKKGTKVSKSLKYFIKDKSVLDKYQTLLSQMVQDCKVSGKLVFSVHPLDFISLSENAHNWRSCHALDGEYRAGNLSYMQDSSTFIVYLKSSQGDNYVLPNFPDEVRWNSKKWRVLMFTNSDNSLFVSGKQYPCSNSHCLDIVLDKLRIFYDLSLFTPEWTDIDDEIFSVMTDVPNSLQYNDCLASSTYKVVGVVKGGCAEIEQLKNIRVGSEVECLVCGRYVLSKTDSMVCHECGDYTYCEYCGEPGHEDEMYYLEGKSVCSCCWDECSISCDECFETFNSEVTNMHYISATDEYLCPRCFLAKKEKI